MPKGDGKLSIEILAMVIGCVTVYAILLGWVASYMAEWGMAVAVRYSITGNMGHYLVGKN